MNDLLHKLIKTIHSNIVNFCINECNQVVHVNFSVTAKDFGKFKNIQLLVNQFPIRDTIQLQISDVVDETLLLSNIDINYKENAFKEYFGSINENDILEVVIDINKKIEKGVMSVYNYEAFNEYLLSLDLVGVINFIEIDIMDEEQLTFEFYDKEIFLATNTIIFRTVSELDVNIEKYKRTNILKMCKKNSCIFWKNQKLLIPDDFHFVVDSTINPYKELFGKIESMLAMMYIVDSVRFSEDMSGIICNILGQRMNIYEFKINDIKYNEILYDIYSWIYNEGNVVDKVTLARNLLSLHCKYISIQDIDEQTFVSIKANFTLYQKDNVDKYIEIKNKMTEFLSDIIYQSKEIIMEVVGELGKNVVAFFSFILTIFVSTIMSEKGLDNIFTREVTYFSYIIIVGSIIYIIITDIIVNFKIKKLTESYDIIKENNNFFEGSKEYGELFDDKKIENIKAEINKQKWIIYLFWILLVIAVFIVIEVLSDYSITKAIKDVFCK